MKNWNEILKERCDFPSACIQNARRGIKRRAFVHFLLTVLVPFSSR